MLFNTLLTLSLISTVFAIPQEPPKVFTVTRQVQMLTDVAPFIVTSTSIFTFTASPTTTIVNPTGIPSAV
ncbi:hypothetical protein C8R45DRAFT_1221216 [Mycena sanguinolenta]|nr:hypothetical protein C8R45DRAFT_1221216 [Mycena sanguinolenta]